MAVPIGAGKRTTRGRLLSWRVAAALLACAVGPAVMPAFAQPQPILDVAPLRLAFSGDDRAERLPSQRVEIRNAGGGQLVWQARADAAWVLVTPQRGLAPGALQIGVDARLLRPGDYEAHVLVDSAGADRSPQTVLVRVTLTSTQPPGPPSLLVAPARVTLSATPGQAQAVSSSLRLTAERDAAVEWSARTDDDWLAVAPARGTTPATITVTATPSGLSLGDHAGNVLVSPAGRGATLRVPVIISVQPPGGPLAFASSALPDAIVNERYSYALPVRGGRPPYSFQLAGSLPPDLSLANGVIGGVAKVPGSFEFSIIATDSGTAPASVTQPLKLRVVPPGRQTLLVVDPDRVSFLASGTAKAPGVTIRVSSIGTMRAWHATADMPWVQLREDGGESTGTFTVTADSAGMKPGTYRAWITVTMDGAENSPVRIPVELTVRD